MSARTPLVCLVAVQDGATELPRWLEAAERVADVVIALDRGSTDGTAGILAASGLVHDVLRVTAGEPVGLGYNRLLQVAGALQPRSVLILKIEEQIAGEDAAALCSFVRQDVLPGLAYGLRLVREASGGAGYDLTGPVAYRLFAYAEDVRLGADSSELALVPTSIPPARWLPTTLRIRTALGPPDGVPPGWGEANGVPGVVRAWRPRPRDLAVLDLTPGPDVDPTGSPGTGGRAPSTGKPVVLVPPAPTGSEPDGPMATAPTGAELDGPMFSVVIDGGDDWAQGQQTLTSVQAQECEDWVEVVIVAPRTSAPVRAVGNITVVAVPPDAGVDERRRVGLAAATGDYVLFLSGGTVVLPDGLQSHMRAHERGYPIVAGAVLNGTRSPVGWASYFLEHSGNLPGRPGGERTVPPPGCSVLRKLLDPVDPAAPGTPRGWEGVWPGLEGARVWVTHQARRIEPAPSGGSRIGLVRTAFARGRQMVAGPRAGARPHARMWTWATFGPVELSRIDANVAQWGGDLRPMYRRARPWVVAAIVAMWAGGWVKWAEEAAARFNGPHRRGA